MKGLGTDYGENIRVLSSAIGAGESFDIIERHLEVAGRDTAFFYIDGFVKDGEMQRVMQTLLAEREAATAEDIVKRLPYVEVEISSDAEKIVRFVLSGQTAIIGESFAGKVILVDARTYPARITSEPDSDRVMQGSHDGFVETLVVNTALIRRRVRDPRLRMRYVGLDGMSKTDIVVCYMDGVADEKLVSDIIGRLDKIKPRSLTLGFQSLAESLIRRGWLNPFPKIRTTERPDTAAAQLVEGSVLVICDNSPQVMVLPTSIFAYLQQADDYYFPPLTGSYLRIVRTLMLLLSVFVTPLWYLYLEYAELLPAALRFLMPDDPGALPIILQLLLAELAIDGLKIASMNTPNSLSNSLSVVGGLLLGDFAVSVGWLCPDVILYMAFVAIASFAQQNNELGYAFKFMRMITLVLVFGFGVWGLLLGALLLILAVSTNITLTGKRHYLYPLVPFDASAIKRILFRTKKWDFEE